MSILSDMAPSPFAVITPIPTSHATEMTSVKAKIAIGISSTFLGMVLMVVIAALIIMVAVNRVCWCKRKSTMIEEMAE